MCTISINIDEASLQSIAPYLNGAEAISRWLQEKVDLWIRQHNPDKSTFDLSHLHPDPQHILSSPIMDKSDVGLNGENVIDEYCKKNTTHDGIVYGPNNIE